MSELQQSPGLKEHNVKMITAIFIIYSLAAGGCFGIENMIPASGPGLTLVMLLVLPFIWAAPQALVSAELGSAIPLAGGYYKWIQRGLGEFWAFQAGWCRTLSCYLDNTIYVVLAASYLGKLVPMTETQAYIVKAVIIIIFTVINLRGIKEVGMVTSIISVIVLAMFAFITVVGFLNWNSNPFVPFTPPEQSMLSSIGLSLCIGMWFYSGYTAMSTLAGDMKNKQVIPKAMLVAMPLIAITYFLPTMASLGAIGDWTNWSSEGGGVGYSTVAALAGPAFGVIFIIVAVLAEVSIFNTYITSISRGFFAMAEDHLAPKSLVKCSKKYGVPYVAVLSLGVFCLIACRFDFSVIVIIDVMLLMVDYILVWISGAVLRIKEPNMKRPFKIPVGTAGFICIITPGILVAIFAVLTNGLDYFVAGMIGFLTAPIMYVIFKIAYGGMTRIDAEKYPLNQKTKLGIGDLNRMAVMFFVFFALGVFAYAFIPLYEGTDTITYYADLYGPSNMYYYFLNGIKIITIIYLVIGVMFKIAARKLEPTKGKSAKL